MKWQIYFDDIEILFKNTLYKKAYCSVNNYLDKLTKIHAIVSQKVNLMSQLS